MVKSREKLRESGVREMKRPCERCNKIFIKLGRYSNYCDNCKKELLKEGRKND